MCITTEDARLDATCVGAWDIQHPKYGYRHVLAYQNKPQNLSDKPNCMLLHVPSAEPLTPENIVDTRDCPNLFSQLQINALKKTNHLGRGGVASAPNHLVTMGIYHIAILNNVKQAEEVISKIPRQKQPKIKQTFFDFYQKYFPNYPLLLCCFNNQDIAKASPILIHYSPINRDYLMIPNLEGHGSLPIIGEKIATNRMYFYGTTNPSKINPRITNDIPKNLHPFLPKWIDTQYVDFFLPNTDVLIELEDIRQGGDVRPYFKLLSEMAN